MHLSTSYFNSLQTHSKWHWSWFSQLWSVHCSKGCCWDSFFF